MDSVLDLARWQFGIVTVYHFFFVPLTIGLSFLVAVMETIWLRTRRQEWLRLTKFFSKLFLINIAMGVVTGIVQEFQFGMNWSDYSRFVGDVFGAPLAVEALLAFFLESTFIGLWIFGWDKLPRGLHAGCMWIVHLGTLASSWFILAANSWMQHPVGYRFNPDSGRAELTDFWAVMFNKVQLGTFPHVIGAAYMTGAAFLIGISAWLYVRGKREDQPLYRRSIRLGSWVLFIAGIAVVISGDVQGKIMTEVQPMKMASAEALWQTSDSCAPFSILTIGTRDGQHKKWALEVPCVLSFLGTGTFDGKVQGIYNLQEEYREKYGADRDAVTSDSGDYTPIIPVTYWSFRWMMGLGAAGAAGAALILWLTRKGRTPTFRWFAPLAISVPLFVLLSNSVGWIFTEMGRQPWVVFGLMTTSNAVSPGVSAWEVWTSLIGFTLVYLVLAIVEVGLLIRFVKKGVDAFVEPPEPKWRRDPDEPDDADRPLNFAY
ncbi:cytochrome ubiquinol oxidase subunit I [Nocardioides sp. Kera G14]|uniref:cytochrome ubiquinol oxidase subunit I n=1 Tax=Nocardioides sp. Kera G14 TaxID=2884264 RepID=UPI001D12CEB1|nr:cytochrome ubiquinol oxidase subunit I [Nocardioides sp. Kera G14]UDY22980.1 cytochrome ubiquinol oxidase subunit I [Nocardioides sp. Kera G14]